MTRKLTKSEAGALGGRANGSRTRQWVRIEAYRAIEQQLVQAREEIKELKRQDDFAEQMSELIVTHLEGLSHQALIDLLLKNNRELFAVRKERDALTRGEPDKLEIHREPMDQETARKLGEM